MFADNGDTKLIDFDLAAKVGKHYPPGYNDEFYERHLEAKSGNRQEIVHDRYSLIYMVKTNVITSQR